MLLVVAAAAITVATTTTEQAAHDAAVILGRGGRIRLRGRRLVDMRRRPEARGTVHELLQTLLLQQYGRTSCALECAYAEPFRREHLRLTLGTRQGLNVCHNKC